jgi:serine/threonine protein kinase
LCDFGLSRVIDDSMTKNIGTVAWIAPEVLSSKGDYSEKADVYSFGINQSVTFPY